MSRCTLGTALLSQATKAQTKHAGKEPAEVSVLGSDQTKNLFDESAAARLSELIDGAPGRNRTDTPRGTGF